ncbi:hypothetical protein PR202_ga30200 [Eleusine coracana subsp. coracana]|uniref:Uncharacterized protein n=1 Tax=Eleusine coracana subsp. coracana TaxID=191504 RepID=A0AAV5DNC4_ELECO|nr:hypothetical protein PR202_ga30200 [Eleusine coracana subsp. coracana]
MLTAALEASETRVTEITEQRDTLAQEVDRRGIIMQQRANHNEHLQQQLASAQQEMDLMGEDLETLIHENQDLQAQLDAVAAPQAAPAEEEPEEDAGEESDVDYEPLAPTGADRPGPSGTAGVQAWQMVRTRNTNELHGEQPEGSRARETDSPLGTPPPPPPSNPMQMMAQFFASMMESQQQQAEFMREVARQNLATRNARGHHDGAPQNSSYSTSSPPGRPRSAQTTEPMEAENFLRMLESKFWTP